jgi:signal peptidase I
MTVNSPRKLWVAFVFSFCCPGLGHLYVDRLSRGLTMFLGSLIIAPATALLAGIVSTAAAALILIGSAALWLFALVDSCRLAARGPTGEKREFQQPVIYVLFLVAGIASTTLTTAFVRGNLLEAFYLPTDSMSPTFRRGDRILANKSVARLDDVRRFDVVVFRVPDDQNRKYIKRIIGLPGDTVEVENGRTILNGRVLDPTGKPVLPRDANEHSDGLPSDAASPESTLPRDHPQSWIVPPGTCFVLGDNRENSRDSRDFGPVPMRDILGVAEFIFLPGDSWSRFGPVVNRSN